jgi:hypothetical protein
MTPQAQAIVTLFEGLSEKDQAATYSLIGSRFVMDSNPFNIKKYNRSKLLHYAMKFNNESPINS